jgi:hypothetical protein
MINNRLVWGERREASRVQMPHFCVYRLLSSFTGVALSNVIKTLLSTFTHTHAYARAYACEGVCMWGVGKEERRVRGAIAGPSFGKGWPTFALSLFAGALIDPSNVSRHGATVRPTARTIQPVAFCGISTILRQEYDSEPVRFCGIADLRVIGTSGPKHAGEACGNSRKGHESLFHLSEPPRRFPWTIPCDQVQHHPIASGERPSFVPPKASNVFSGTSFGSSF